MGSIIFSIVVSALAIFVGVINVNPVLVLIGIVLMGLCVEYIAVKSLYK